MQDINFVIKTLNDYCEENSIYYLDDVEDFIKKIRFL